MSSSYSRVNIQKPSSMDFLKKDLKRFLFKRKWKEAIQVMTRCPRLASEFLTQRCSNGEMNQCLALHLVCQRKPPLEIVLQLLALNISATKEKDCHGRLPLHHACRYNAKHEICRLLIAVYPDGPSTRAMDGTLPLHTACLYGRDGKTVDVLIEAYSGAVNRWDDMGLTPWDYAMDNPHSKKTDIQLSLYKIKMKHSPSDYFKDFDDAQETDSDSDNSFHGKEDKEITKKDNISYMDDNKIQKSATKSCVVCMDKDVSHILLPCGHPCLCEKCCSDDSMFQMGWRCPECRAPVREAAKVFGRVVID